MIGRRVQRINSLLREVIAEVISRDLENKDMPSLLSITEVDTTKDLSQATVYISLINANADEKTSAIKRLNELAGYIGVIASKKVVIRYFPTLTFKIDDSTDNFLQIDGLLKKISDEKVNE